MQTTQTVRAAVFAALFLAGATVTTASGQVVGGSALYFDHSTQDYDDTERYELCVDTVTDASCTAVGAVLASAGTGENGTNVYRFTLPTSVARGNRLLRVRAVGRLDAGTSDPSNALAVRVIGKPGPPLLLRLPPAVTP